MPGFSLQLAIQFDGERLLAAAATATGERLSVKSILIAPRPDGVDPASAQAVGEWIGAEIERAGIRSAANQGVLIVLTRTDAVLKHLALPPGISAAELPGTVRLAVMRHIPFASESSAVDFVPLGSTGPSPMFLAAAISDAMAAWYADVARCAGFKVRRMVPGSIGAAALLGTAPGLTASSATLVTLLSSRGGTGGCEFLVVNPRAGVAGSRVVGGDLLFSRGADVPATGAATDQQVFIETVLVEAKRTYLAYRMDQNASEIGRVVVLGAGKGDGFAAGLAERLGKVLELPGGAIELPRGVEMPSGGPGQAESVELVSVLGALFEQTCDGPTIDLTKPRRAPDLGAARRRVAVFAALGVLCLLVVLSILGRNSLESLRAQRQALRDEFNTRIAPAHAQYLRARLRAEHIERTLESGVDWVAHLRVVSELMPDPKDAVMDSFVAESDTRVEFAWPKNASRTLATGRWSPVLVGTLQIGGTTKQQGTANKFRQRFEEDDRYKILTPGAEVPNRFEYRITTTTLRPDSSSDKKPAPPRAETKGPAKPAKAPAKSPAAPPAPAPAGEPGS